MTTNSAKLEIRTLKRQKATRAQFEARAEYFLTSAANYEAEFARDLAAWEAGTNTRPDLADPRDPSVAASRAALVADMRQTAADIRSAAPTE